MNKTLKELYILHFLNDGVRTTFLVILPFIAKDIALSFAHAGLLGSLQALFVTALSLPAGFIASRVGGFHLLLGLLLIYSIGSFTSALSPNLLLLIFSFTIAAIGFGMFHTVGFVVVANISNKTNMGRNMGEFTAVGDIGRIAIPPLALVIASTIGWRPTMLGLCGIALIAYVLFRFFLPSKDVFNFKNPQAPETYKDFVKSALLLVKIKSFFTVFLASIFDSFASSPIYIFLPFLLLAKGITPPQLGIITAVFFAGSLIGKTILGRGVDAFGNKRMFIGSEVVMAVLLIVITLSSDFLLLLALSLFLGAFTKGTSPVVHAMFSNLSHNASYEKVYAISEIGIGAASMVSQVITGFAADRLGISAVFYLCALVALFAIVPVLTFSTPKSKISL